MKRLLNVICIVFFTLISSAQTSAKYSVGDYAHGGIVFYVDNSGEHGLVCATQDQSTNATWFSRRAVKKHNRLSEEMFTTEPLVLKNSKDSRNFKNSIASKVCKNYKTTENSIVYKDWYLPSKEELHKMYVNKALINTTILKNGGEILNDAYYWSATEFNYSRAWAQYFKNGKQIDYFKDYECHVRAVRSF